MIKPHQLSASALPLSTRYDARRLNVVLWAFNGCASPLAISGSGLSGRKADSFADSSSDILLRDILFPP